MSRIIVWRTVRNLSVIAVLAAGCGDDQGPPDGGASEGGGGAGQAGATEGGGGERAGGGGEGPIGGQGGAGGGGGGQATPDTLILTGLAEGTSEDGTETVTCDLAGRLTDIVVDGTTISGTFSGEFLRRVEVGDKAFAFEPFVAGPASIDRSDDPADLRLVGDQPDDAKPYWLRLEVLRGDEVAPFEFEGNWDCAPLDLDGDPPDFTTTVSGTFRLGPAPMR